MVLENVKEKMKLRECLEHGYTLKEKCAICGSETKDAHYKFVKIKSIDELKLK